MKLIVVLSIGIFFYASAESYAQKVTFNKKNATLKEVFDVIQYQTGYNFIISSDLLKEASRLDIDLRNTPLKEAIDKSLVGQPFGYTIHKNTIIVSKISQTKNGQSIEVSGRVTDSNEKPLWGVNIQVKGTSKGTVSNNNGEFKIPVPDRQTVLIFSYIGYSSQEVTIGEQIRFAIVLKEELSKLDEVVIGYGTERRSDLTGSVAEVNVADMQKAPVMSFEEALAGRAAGVQVTSNDGQPGEGGINIVIRGANSLTQDNSPLYVIDGFLSEDSENAAINPDDIETITVLKDASATAIYGARGANGVIVIETKKGKLGQPDINFSSNIGMQRITRTIDMMDAYDFVRYQYERSPATATSLYLTDGKTIEDYQRIKGTDWQDLLFRQAMWQSYNVSVRGGTKDTKYSLSGSTNVHEGVVVNSGTKRYQGRIVVDQDLNKKLKAGVNVNLSSLKGYGQLASAANSVAGSGASTYLLYSTWGYRPVTGSSLDLEDNELEYELLDPDIDHSTDYRINPIISAKNELREATTTTITANSYLTYAINRDLTVKVTGGIDRWSRKDDSFFNSNTSRGTPLLPGNTRGQWGSVFYGDRFTWLNENTITWRKTYKKIHRLNVVGGFTMQGRNTQNYGFTSQNVPNEELGLSGLDEGTTVSSRANTSHFTMASFLSRANYSYRSRYYLTATFRADGSSKFPAGNKWGYFPSAAFSWRMREESFMKGIKVISDAKIRASYGVTGNNRVSDFASFAGLNMPILNSYSFNNATPQSGVNLNSLGNLDLLWESTAQIDFGLDLSLFNNRISFTGDVYRKNTYDLLLNANLPATTGYARVFKNIGKVRNQGLELTLNSVNVKKKAFAWESNFNISFNQNKILALAENENNMLSTVSWETSFNTTPLYIAAVNEPAAMFYGYIWDGVYQYGDFDITPTGQYILKNNMATNGRDRNSIAPGDIKYVDINNDGVVNDLDRTILGRTNPIHTGGFSNNFSYKGISLNVFFQWAYGNKIYNANRIMFEGNAGTKGSLNQYASYNDRWTPENQSNTLFRTGGAGPYGVYSSRVLEDGSYIRLKTISLAYSFPEALYSKLWMRGLSMNVSAQNLYTWTNYSGMDPEVSVRNSTLTPGFDYSAYPRAFTLVMGVKALF